MKRRIFNIKGKRLVEGDANLTNQDEILVKELQDNRVALLENIDGKLVNIGGLEEEKEKRPEIVGTVVKAKQHLLNMRGLEEINLTFDKGNILQYKSCNPNGYIVYIKDKHGTVIRTLSGSGSYLEKIALSYGANMENKCFILTPYISDNVLSVATEVTTNGYYELENVLDSNGERQLIQIRNGYCVTPFGGGTKPMRFRYPLLGDALRIWLTRNEYPLPEDTIGSGITQYLHVLFKKNPLFTFDNVNWLNRLSDEELKNHLISVKTSRSKT